MQSVTRAIALVGSILLLAGCAATARPGWTAAASGAPSTRPSGGVTAVASTPGATASAAATTGSTSQPGTGAIVGTIEIKAFDLGFDPAMVMVGGPGTYTVNFINTGAIEHNVTFDDGTVITAAAGRTVTGTVNVPALGIGFQCTIPGHAAAGMTGIVMTTAGMASGAPATSPGASPSHNPDDHGGPPPAVPGVAPDTTANVYKLYNATAPAPLPGTVHDIDLVVTEGPMVVAPGYVVDVWTFNGTVPGPVIRVKVGDTVRIHLKNPATNAMSHSVDFHASQVAWNDEMTSIAPGEEKVYEWTAQYAGVWMYHCGTASALEHIANGMYGMVIVDPAAGLPPVDHEFALVQSEWYIAGQDQPVSYEKASAAAPAPDFVVFNGIANQYKDHPLEVATGDTVRFFVLDAGPNIDSSFHIVGTIFNHVIKEGVVMDSATNGGWASQAVDLSPAQGAEIELTTPEDGLYPIVTHAFNFVGRGALGLLQSGDGDPTN